MKKALPVLIFLLVASIQLEAAESRPASGEISTPPPEEAIQKIREGYQKHDYRKVSRYCKDLPSGRIPFYIQMICAESHAAAGETEAAIRLLQSLLREDPPGLDRLKAQYDLANLYFMQGRYAESRKVFEQVLETATEREEWVRKARQKIVQLRQKEGKSKDQITLQLLEVEERIEKGIDLYATKGVLKEILSRTERRQPQQNEQAKELLERLKDKESSLVTSELANVHRLYREEKKLAQARELLQKLLLAHPDMEERPHVEALLEEVEHEEEADQLDLAKKGKKRR
ncbi:MAG: tetratricopeptide repeat protein [Deltaproteobacteria bacterium]|nr:tetratricopeptide repeat protein [Deltaproteobacteria bacterium]